MGVRSRIKRLIGRSRQRTATDPVQPKARSLAAKLAAMRGNNITLTGSSANAGTHQDQIANTVAKARDIGLVTTRSEGKTLETGKTYRPHK